MMGAKPLRILVTAGPTREYLDPVRYLSNDSSGQMGFALAQVAAEFGAAVTLIAGPVSLPTPKGVKRIDVVSACEMHRAVLKQAPRSDVILMAAAVADWRPAKASKAKIKKTVGASCHRAIALTANPDILAELGRRKKPEQLLAGFALETNDLERNARSKLTRKRCDWIVANAAKAIGASSSRALLLGAHGERIPLPRLPKEDLAVLILSHLLEARR